MKVSITFCCEKMRRCFADGAGFYYAGDPANIASLGPLTVRGASGARLLVREAGGEKPWHACPFCGAEIETDYHG